MTGLIPKAGFTERLYEEERLRFETICPPRIYPKGQAIFRQGDPVEALYVLREGEVKLVRTGAEGHERIVWLAGPGEVLGVNLFTPNAQHTLEAVCLRDTVACPVNREQFLRVAREVPRVTLALCEVLTERLEYLEEQLELAAAPTLVRLGRTLLWLAKRFGCSETDGWTRLTVRVRHEDLAALIGANRVTTTYAMRKLTQAGLVRGTRGRYALRVRDLEAYLERSP